MRSPPLPDPFPEYWIFFDSAGSKHLRWFFQAFSDTFGGSKKAVKAWNSHWYTRGGYTSANMINKVYSHLSPNFMTDEIDKMVIGGKTDTSQTEQTAS